MMFYELYLVSLFHNKISLWFHSILQQVKETLLPESNFQVLFTTRHLTNWAKGMGRYEIAWNDIETVLKVKISASYTPRTIVPFSIFSKKSIAIKNS